MPEVQRCLQAHAHRNVGASSQNSKVATFQLSEVELAGSFMHLVVLVYSCF